MILEREMIISCENVSFCYDAEENDEQNKAVKNVSLSIEKGTFVAILGRN